MTYIEVPQNPPVVYQEPGDQTQKQKQNQYQDQGDNIINDYSDNSAESRSRSENVSNFSGNLSNIAIQNNNSSYFQYEQGVRIPSTALTVSGWANEYNHGIQAAITWNLGKKQRRKAYEQIEARTQELQINNAARQLTACANVNAAGYTVEDWAAIGLPLCSKMKKTVVAKAPDLDQYKNLIEEQRQAIQKQQVLIQKLLIQIDDMQTENNNPFNSRG